MFKQHYNNLIRLLLVVYLLVGFDIFTGAAFCHRTGPACPPTGLSAIPTPCDCVSAEAFGAKPCRACCAAATLSPQLKSTARLSRNAPQKVATGSALNPFQFRAPGGRPANATRHQLPSHITLRSNLSTVVLRC